MDSPCADLEIMLMMAECMNTIGAGATVIHFSHRGMFNTLLKELGATNLGAEILRIVDKRAKIGDEEVKKLLLELIPADAATVLRDFITPKSDNRATLRNMAALAAAEETAPYHRIQDILDAAEELGMAGVVYLDPSITRGLDYYTGIVFETFLNDLPELGSVCSGGRYDNLTGLFMKEPLSGVGASIGLDRLMAGMEELGRLEKRHSSTDVLIIMLDGVPIDYCHNIARELRRQGLAVEVYPEAKKIAVQFKYAETRDIPLVLIVGPDEKAAGTVNLKDLRSRKSYNGLDLTEAWRKVLTLMGKN
ncbi:MAG: hypothetical protein B0D92_07460 [Spirochaeta sp. LUC14_002_19_P3]|nr:MAG: hypothetical protein B0D92_07460 [Spirochaeta sp. LUC14_002_19_P3]